MILLLRGGQRVPAVAARLGVGADVVRGWLKRFNSEGLDGLKDRPRSGRPATYTPEQVGAVVEASLTKPADLGLPFASWTLDRLAAYLQEGKGIPIKRPQTHDLLMSVIDSLGGKLESISISDLREHTFFAILNVRDASGKLIKIDSRPSDAIALGIASNVPIYVEEKVLDAAQGDE